MKWVLFDEYEAALRFRQDEYLLEKPGGEESKNQRVIDLDVLPWNADVGAPPKVFFPLVKLPSR